MKSNVYSLQLTQTQEEKLFNTFKEYKTNPPQYAKWALKCENCSIVCYESGKTVFQGKESYVYASPFMKEEDIVDTQQTKDIFPQAGSDEVGTGDYFGPVVVCGCIVTQETNVLLKELGVRDSKQLNDEDILKIGPTILEKIPHSILIVNNEKYNEVHQSNNLNEIKAKLHNQVYVHLKRKFGLPKFKIIDQFTPEKSYYRYLMHEDTVISKIHFETKAEDKYPAVGAASVLARYTFLKEWEQMEKKYSMTFIKGAGSKVDECAKEFVNKYGKEELNKVAKLHFKNTEKL